MSSILLFLGFLGLLTLRLTFFYLPAGVANMSPVFFQRAFGGLAVPVDFGWTIAGEPVFGAHKTWRGLITATLFGGIFFYFEQYLVLHVDFMSSWVPFDMSKFPWWFGFLFAFGAIMGDLVKSFFKRRMRIPPGDTWFPFDQIDFVLGASLILGFFVEITTVMWVILISFGTIMHIVGNHAGYWLGIKNSPW
jgi:CDP-2,3-bis-(O-geranylgeranyl)-sn-glycerol synthase